ncbi:M23 family metallopeptidase [Nocardioides sp. Arc9.136]|uniref:M23 family metallopeptidase n=1 Tax=Nocardioides sp. Arc9.136 TaxID=2996826 RepID=UPI0026663704|nr:M23 family metallopeptidase [Nocardioides sp. Arc9.136]WKN49934.1 M23 family metallopeptidase [Nocardioides sp. Arc9.136]
MVSPTLAAAVLLLLPSPAGAGAPAGSGTDPVGEWPLRPEPAVVEHFDPPDDPYGAGHRGVDLLGSPGQPVHAALAGRVSWAGTLAGRGVVVVDHGTTRTTYEPVSAALAVGTVVTAGDMIGTLQVPGSHCFPRACLHWGWIEGETYLDPLDLVGAGPVRLLPLWRDEPVTGRVAVPVAHPSVAHPYDGWRPQARGCACW